MFGRLAHPVRGQPDPPVLRPRPAHHPFVAPPRHDALGALEEVVAVLVPVQPVSDHLDNVKVVRRATFERFGAEAVDTIAEDRLARIIVGSVAPVALGAPFANSKNSDLAVFL